MRRRLYGSLAALAALGAGAVLITGATEGDCTIVCTWQLPVAVVGLGAMLAAAAVAMFAVAYEVSRAVRQKREPW